MPTLDELRGNADELIRKGLDGLVAIAPMSVTADITTLKDGSGLLALPAGYVTVGRVTKEQGVSWTRDVATSETMSLGASEPTRVDITSDTSGMQFTMQESKKAVFELYDGVDLTGKLQDATGNVYWDKPGNPLQPEYRVLALFKDGDGAEAVYFAKWLPRARVSDRSEQSWQPESEVQYGITLSGFVDSTIGTSMRSLWAGPAQTMTDMGFATA